MTPLEFIAALQQKLSAFDKTGAALVCKQLIASLYGSDGPVDIRVMEKILQLLRSKRMFGEMQQVADALIFTGRPSSRIYRQYAQCLIDTGCYTAALCLLNHLHAGFNNAPPGSAEAKREFAEAQGLTGRLYKQLYVNHAGPNPYKAGLLKQAIQSYHTVYATDPEAFLWHGINTVALLYRAQADGIPMSGFPDYTGIATAILKAVQDKEAREKADAWDCATAMEACIALGRPPEAEKWAAYYASSPDCDAFELSSTLRQLEEVWQLDINSEAGEKILPVLRSELLKRQGGNVIIDAAEIREHRQDNTAFEKNFGPNVFIDFMSYKKGYSCCESVARIGRGTLKGDGTGFLIKGEVLHEQFAGELLLVTNAHVMSEDIAVQLNYGALNPLEAIIIFEALDRDQQFRVGAVLWSSPPLQLDVTIIRFGAADLERLKTLTRNVALYTVSPILPVTAGDPMHDPRLYVIGHPKGGPLQFSMQDNLMLDREDPRIHYRTPTEGGSSGSPVFNQQWELVGVHHFGKKNMKRLNGMQGEYEANEGIWIQAIISGFRKALELPPTGAFHG